MQLAAIEKSVVQAATTPDVTGVGIHKSDLSLFAFRTEETVDVMHEPYMFLTILVYPARDE